MEGITFYLIVLFCYSTLALIFISFNMVYPKKYINLISISHILGLIAVIFMIFKKITNNDPVISCLSVFFFLCTHFTGYVAINSFLKKKFPIYLWMGLIFLALVDLAILNFILPISIFIHKILLMAIYIYLGINILKLKNKTFSIYFFGISVIGFAAIQIIFGFIWLLIIKKEFYIDFAGYILQTLTYSLAVILITLEEARKDFNLHVNELKEEVKSNQKRLQEVYELDKLKTEFIANISHELRTPINIIFSSIQLFEVNFSKDFSPKQSKALGYIKTMKQNCFRLIKLVNNLIDMSKIEAGFVKLNSHNWDIVKIVEDITLSVVPYAEEKNINIEFDTEFEEKLIVCDIEKIERVMLNLLSNAVKFTGKDGKIKVYLNEGNDEILISVKDNGIGISKDMQELIYNRFTQVTDTFVRENEGSGIGLSLVKSLIELHGGRITLESEPGEGCEFIVALPLRLLENDNLDNLNLSEISMKKVEIEFSDI